LIKHDIGKYKFSYKFKIPNKITDYDYSLDESKRFISYLSYTLTFYDKYTDAVIVELKFTTDELLDFIDILSFIINSYNAGSDIINEIISITSYNAGNDNINEIIQCKVYGGMYEYAQKILYDSELVVRYEVTTQNIVIESIHSGMRFSLTLQEAQQLISTIEIPDTETVEAMLDYAKIQETPRRSNTDNYSGGALWTYGFNII